MNIKEISRKTRHANAFLEHFRIAYLRYLNHFLFILFILFILLFGQLPVITSIILTSHCHIDKSRDNAGSYVITGDRSSQSLSLISLCDKNKVPYAETELNTCQNNWGGGCLFQVCCWCNTFRFCGLLCFNKSPWAVVLYLGYSISLKTI